MSDFTVQPILDFWRAAGPDKWFAQDEVFDAEVTRRLLPAHEAAAAGDLDQWGSYGDGALALLILLDQAPRNMYRGTPRAFATDAKALSIAHAAVEAGFERGYEPDLRQFFYMPFMHAEDLAAQERCIALFRAAGDENGTGYAVTHRDVIARFGRFPHRNVVLGRSATSAEQAFLESGGFSA